MKVTTRLTSSCKRALVLTRPCKLRVSIVTLRLDFNSRRPAQVNISCSQKIGDGRLFVRHYTIGLAPALVRSYPVSCTKIIV